MDQTTASIKLWGEWVGAVSWSSDEQVGTFEFAPRFSQNKWDIAPILMPIDSPQTLYTFYENRGDSSTFKGLPGLLADILPDKYGNALIQAWLSSKGRSSESLSPIEALCFIGKRGMGALEIEPSNRDDDAVANSLDLSELVNVANRILADREIFSADLSNKEEAALTDVIQIGTSAGGARAKAIIAFNETTKEVKSGQVKAPDGFSYWIVKFDGVVDSQFGVSEGYGQVEMAYHLMAKEAGIYMSDCQLFKENGRSHFMTKRFDREANGDKIHLQSFCAMRHFDYNLVGYYAYEQLFETMRMLGLSYVAAEQVFRRMVFNVLSRNCDDHTKNFAFLMDKSGKWSLSPAFDICHAYRPDSPWVNEQSLLVNGKRSRIQKDDFLAVAKSMNIKRPDQIINEISTIIGRWNNYAEEVELKSTLRDAIKSTLLV